MWSREWIIVHRQRKELCDEWYPRPLGACRGGANACDTLLEAKALIASRRREYNTVRLHSSLGYIPRRWR
jgi:hypothetical protein